MNVQVHTIRAAGKKNVPDSTALVMRLGTVPGTVSIQIKLPGQKNFTDLGDIKIVDGVIELPVKLLFFSYAREDQSIVNEIAENLWQDGFLTWIDSKDLRPGDDWKARIENAIETADFVLLFLSKTSCSKVGYVQRELKYALEQRDLRPSGQRYIIPVLLEPCEPPRELRDIHWLKLWEDGAYKRLKSAFAD
jgi:hypothetical protein